MHRLRKQHSLVNKMLARYSLKPQVLDWIGGGLSHNLFSRHTRGDFSLSFDDPRGRLLITEGTVISSLLEIAKTGNMWRVRLCEYCKQRWRVSQRPRDRFHEDKCRIAFYNSRPEARKKHVVSQQKYRTSAAEKAAAARKRRAGTAATKILRNLGK